MRDVMRDPPSDRPPSSVVQRSVGPTIGLCTDPLLYARGNDFVHFDHRRRAWRIAAGGRVSFDTYFNGLSVLRWKHTAPLADLSVEFAFVGRFVARLHLMQVGPIATLIDEIEIASDVPTKQRWRVDDWPTLGDGILFVSLHAVDGGELHGFAFVTSTPPRRAVRLGLCITHFNRQAQIVPAIARLKAQLLDDPDLGSRIGLFVVDNSSNLDGYETAGATVLRNRNLGGSGGFARGLMHLKDDGGYTHALFMDDDASCEVESIRRTVALLTYAEDARTAVSGAMLRKCEPYRQFERGARIQGLCRPLRSGVDLRDPGVLAWNEREMTADYGGWWFFAFPIATAVGYPYPYFVRGDDVDYALRNDFRLVHANGIASWQEDFAVKHAPQTHYLDTRSHLLHMLHGYGGGRLGAMRVAARQFLLPNLAGQYEQAAAATMALDDVLKGPTFFRDHADLAEPRRRLQAATVHERMRPIDAVVFRDAQTRGLAEPPWRAPFRLATLNGHLIPTWFFRRAPARFGKGFVLPLRGTFRRRRSYVYDEFIGTGMTLDHSKRRFFGNAWRFARAAGALIVRFDDLRAAYRGSYAELTSDAYWRRQFGIAAPAPEPARSTPVATPAFSRAA